MKERVCKECKSKKDIEEFQGKWQVNRKGTILEKHYFTRRWICIKCMNAIYTKNWVRKNVNQHYQNCKRFQKKERAAYSDYAMARMISKYGTSMSVKDVPQELIELQRKKLKILDHVTKNHPDTIRKNRG